VSDTHGSFPTLYGRFDVVVHSGDFFPNSQNVMSNKQLEMAFQLDWLQQIAPVMKQWLRGHTFLFTLGNHDFLHEGMVTMTLANAGINAQCLHDRNIHFQGLQFYGFPYVPEINGMWAYEKTIPEMQIEVDRMVGDLNKKRADVLVCHSPLYKALDLTIGNQLMGSTVISNAIDYKIEKDNMPSHYLCGHCHEGNGVSMRNGLFISNAALTQTIVEV
jgi:Icc-related predicted phosphoesterase